MASQREQKGETARKQAQERKQAKGIKCAKSVEDKMELESLAKMVECAKNMEAKMEAECSEIECKNKVSETTRGMYERKVYELVNCFDLTLTTLLVHSLYLQMRLTSSQTC